MTFKLYIDEDSASHVLRGLLAQGGLDVLSTQEAGMSGASDERQLEYARSVDRVIFSSNRKDFFQLHTEWMQAGRTHAGIVLLARREIPVAIVAQQLVDLSQLREQQDLANVVLFVSRRLE